MQSKGSIFVSGKGMNSWEELVYFWAEVRVQVRIGVKGDEVTTAETFCLSIMSVFNRFRTFGAGGTMTVLKSSILTAFSWRTPAPAARSHLPPRTVQIRPHFLKSILRKNKTRFRIELQI